LQDRPVAYHPILAKVLGSVKAALFLSQLLYWCPRARSDWIYKTANEFYEEIGMSRKEQTTARKLLVKHKVLKEELHGVPPVLHFQIDLEKLESILPDGASQFSPKGKIEVPQKGKTNFPGGTNLNKEPDTTPQNTTESADAPAPEPLTAEQYKKRVAKALASGIAMHNGFTGAIEFEFHIRPRWKTNTAREFVEYMAVEWQPTAEDVHRFAQWWRQNDWRGQKGQAPTLGQIQENWPQAFVSRDEFIPVEVFT